MSDAKSEIDEQKARELLARERERVERSLADLRREVKSSQEEVDTEISPEDDAETIVDEEVDGAVARSLESELEMIKRAEQRLEEGSYGLSVESGTPIPAKRLEHVPYAERTIEEQERYEKRGG
jgi:DnaK suppressor protein